MPEWFSEGRPMMYLLLAAAGIGFAMIWRQTRKRWAAAALGGVVLLGLGYFLLDRAIENDREQITRKLSEIATAVANRDLDRAFANVSDSFQRSGVNKRGFRNYADARRRSEYVSDVQVWDIVVPDVTPADRRTVVECAFKVRGSFGETPPGAFTRVTFVRDADGQWRAQNFDWFLSIADSNSPMPVPGWGGQ